MRHILIATTIGAAATTVAAAAMAAATAPTRVAATAPPCTPKITKIEGHTAAVNCGPATATLRIRGRTYTFHNGFCEQSKAAGSALELTLGTTVIGASGNAGKPDFDMTIGKNHFVAAVSSADYGGKDLLGGEGLINVRGKIPAKGTFTSRVTAGAKFTGSWNCHGVVWQAP
jgi:hypothetical protein